MSTRYSPELDHIPVEWASEVPGDKAEVERLTDALRASAGRIVKAFDDCGVVLEADDLAPLMDRLEAIMVTFVAECRAHPLRTARQLVPTLKEIRTDPEAFLQNMPDYAPEAVAMVYEKYLRLFSGKCDLAAFEAGSGPPPEIGDVRTAADVAISALEEEAQRRGKGRSRMELVDKLSIKLGKQFLGLQGHLGRIVHDVESGPFLSFLEAVVAPARLLVATSGYSLSPESMVRTAQEALASKRRRKR